MGRTGHRRRTPWPSTCCSSTTAAPRHRPSTTSRWTSGRPRRSRPTSQFMSDFAARLEGTGEFVDGQALSPDGTLVRYDGDGQAAGDRRPVRRDQGPDRRLDGHRRRHLRAGASSSPASCPPPRARAASRSTSGSRSARSSSRAARPSPSDAPVDERAAAGRSTPQVLGVLVRRGADFATAEDAVQEALLEALRALAGRPAARPEGLAGHGGLAQVPRRAPAPTPPGAAARSAVDAEPPPGPAEERRRHAAAATSCAPTRR